MSGERHDGGLSADRELLARQFERRTLLRWAVGLSLLPIVGCRVGTATAGVGGSGDACAAIPEETGGPFPGDGSNGPDFLSRTGMLRGDIRPSLPGGTAAGGVPLQLNLSLTDAACLPLAGAAVYVWHCDAQGRYSMYSEGVTDQTFLRGVQVAGADGKVSFTTVFPGCYPGRWPHIHFEVYPSLAAASAGTGKLATSQLALPRAASQLVYASPVYGSSASNLGTLSLATDMVFSDGVDAETPVLTGDAATGYAAALAVPVG